MKVYIRFLYIVSICVAVANPIKTSAATRMVSHHESTRVPKIAFTHDSRSIRIELSRESVPAVRYAALKPTFRYNFRISGEPDRLPAISRGIAYIQRDSAVYSFDLFARTDRLLAKSTPITPVFITAPNVLFGKSDRASYDLHSASVVAIDSASGIERWTTPGQLLGAGSETALINVASDNPKDIFSKHFIALNARNGKRKWINPYGGCRPRPPLTFFATQVLVPWAGPCEVSASEAFLMWFRLDNGATNDTGNATAVLESRGDDVYLTGDDRHWGSYGPGNLSAYDAATATRLWSFTIGPDRPQGDQVALDTTVAGYALGNALWVQLTYDTKSAFYAAAVYRYDIHDRAAPPGRVSPTFGTWLGGAYKDETFFGRGNMVTALQATSNAYGSAATFSGVVQRPVQAIAHDGSLYVREAGGNVAIYDLTSRREVEFVAAGCDNLKEVVAASYRRYLVCRNIDPLNALGEVESDAFIELP